MCGELKSQSNARWTAAQFKMLHGGFAIVRARALTPLMIWRIYYLCEHMRIFIMLVRTHVCAFGIRASSVDATTFNIIITIIMLIIIMIIVLVCRFVLFISFLFLFVFRCWIWKWETLKHLSVRMKTVRIATFYRIWFKQQLSNILHSTHHSQY